MKRFMYHRQLFLCLIIMLLIQTLVPACLQPVHVSAEMEEELKKLEVSMEGDSISNNQGLEHDTVTERVYENLLTSSLEDRLLLYEDFEHVTNGSVPKGWRIYPGVRGAEGEWRVEDGKLHGYFKGKKGGKIVFGEADWDNYIYSAQISFSDWDDTKRWVGLMYRTQEHVTNADYNYQLALRPNGMYEQHQRNKGYWVSGQKYTGYVSPLTKQESFTLEIRVYGDTVRHFINGEQVAFRPDGNPDAQETLQLNSVGEVLTGSVGLSVDYADVVIDHVQVTKLDTVGIFFEQSSMEVPTFAGPLALPEIRELLSDGEQIALEPHLIQYESSDEQVIRIQENQMWPLTEGTATISATYQGQTAASEVQVKPGGVAEIIGITPSKPYVLLTSQGEEQSLEVIATYNDLQEEVIPGEQIEWTVHDPRVVEVVYGQIKPLNIGKTIVNGSYEEHSFTIPVKVNSPDQATLWIEEDFEQVANGQIPEGWKKDTAGVVGVEDGKLRLTSTSTPMLARVDIPLDVPAGDYIFEADVQFESVIDNQRWLSLMYRVQPGGVPYYQFAVRQEASTTNGTEFAYRTPANAWDVIEYSHYQEAMELGKSYRLKVIASGDRIQQYINDQLVIDSDLARELTQGNLGIQVSGATVLVDNVRIYLEPDKLEEIVKTVPAYTSNRNQQIIGAPTLIGHIPQEINTLAKWNKQGISSVLLPLGKQGDQLVVTTPSGSSVHVETLLQEIKGDLIPILKVEESELVDELISVLNSLGIDDIQLLSSNMEIIKKVRSHIPAVRGSLYYSPEQVSGENKADMLKELNESNSRVVVFDQDALTPELVYYFQRRAKQVWTKGNMSSIDVYHSMWLGVNGVIAEDPEMVQQVLSTYPQQSMVRRPLLAGHRGLPTLAPENTLISFQLAQDYGADYIELDILRSKDGHLIIFHDDDVKRMAGVSGLVAQMTLEELKRLDIGKGMGPQFAGEQIPTLQEVLDTFRDQDTVFLLEFKTEGFEEQVLSMVEQANMLEHVVFSSFSDQQLQKVKAINPQANFSYLGRGSIPVTRQTERAKQVIDYNTYLQSVYAPRHSIVYPELFHMSVDRGLPLYLWTVNEYPLIQQFWKDGATTVISDIVDQFATQVVHVQSAESQYMLQVGETRELKGQALLRNQTWEEVDVQIESLSGTDILDIKENKVKALKPGKAQLLLHYSYNEGGQTYHRFSQPIHITVETAGDENTGEDENNDYPGDSGEGDTDEDNGHGDSDTGSSGGSSSGSSSSGGNSSAGPSKPATSTTKVEMKLPIRGEKVEPILFKEEATQIRILPTAMWLERLYKKVKDDTIHLQLHWLSEQEKSSEIWEKALGLQQPLGMHDLKQPIFGFMLKADQGLENLFSSTDYLSPEPLEIRLTLSKPIHVSQELTAIRYDLDDDGTYKLVKLGGSSDQQNQSFKFYSNRLGWFQLVAVESLTQIELGIDKHQNVVNGQVKSLDVPPMLRHDRTLVPLRFISEHLGAKVSWVAAENAVLIHLHGKTLQLNINEPLPGLDSPAIIIEGRTMVPLRYISEYLEANVLWFPSTRTIQIIL